MNYLINIFFCITFILSPSTNLSSQTIELTGNFELIELPVKRTIEFHLVENGRTCGPNTQFETIDEQLAYLKFELLQNDLMRSKIMEINHLNVLSSQYPRRIFSYQFDSIPEAKLFYEKAQEAFAESIDFWNYYSSPSIDDESKYLENCVKDAKQKAEVIANIEGYKNADIISIQDLSKNWKGISISSKYSQTKSTVYSIERIKYYSAKIIFKFR